MIWYARRRDYVEDGREMGGRFSGGVMGVGRYSNTLRRNGEWKVAEEYVGLEMMGFREKF
jgi:hypothetical protein